MSKTISKVWGFKVGECALCLVAPTVTSYRENTSENELMEYQVCAICKELR